MSANARQVGGSHYKSKIQHWDYVLENDLDYFQAQITKYVTRWKKKNGIEDLLKARHFLEKYIEEMQRREVKVTAKALADAFTLDGNPDPTANYVNQDPPGGD